MDSPDIVAIIRDVQPKDVSSVVRVLLEEGLSWIEVSLSEEEIGLESIRVLKEEFGERIRLGAGTVVHPLQVDKALTSGAQYFITPGWDRELIRYIRRKGVPVFPGVYTPGEVMQAVQEGIETVKLFPVCSMGTDYIRHLRGPFPNLRFMAVGGVNRVNLPDFLSVGCSSAAIGSELVPRGATTDCLDRIRSNVRAFLRLLEQRGERP